MSDGPYIDAFFGNCGMTTLYELKKNPAENLRELYEFGAPAIVAFSDAVTFKNGAALARYIRKHKLGHVSSSRRAHNDNSGHYIQAWYWCVDHKALDVHAIKGFK